MLDSVPEVVGMLGVAIVVGAYAWKELKYGFGETVTYSLMNIGGSLLVAYSLLFDWNIAAMTQEVTWILIGVFGLYSSYRRRKT